MAVLGRAAILQAIADGTTTITPFSRELVGPASVDLTLAGTFRVFRKVHQVIEVRENTDYRELSDKIEFPSGQHILIMRAKWCLASHPSVYAWGLACVAGWRGAVVSPVGD